MNFHVEYVIYGCMLLCCALLIYNLFYILRSRGRSARLEKETEKWRREIERGSSTEDGKRPAEWEKNHRKRIRKKLCRTGALLAYGTALERLWQKDEALLRDYMSRFEDTLQYVAHRYEKKESMDKAYFAYLVSRYWPRGGGEFRPIMEILPAYFEHSTIYCRENVLNALYALGNCEAVESALQMLNDGGWFHHRKLLSDGLLSFTGDREKLAERLWSHRKDWNETIMLAVIQFITGFSDRYREEFLLALKEPDVNLEHRLAMLRYYRRHVYEPVRPLLYSYLSGGTNEENLTIVAVSVLSGYPGKTTVRLLKQALHHANWYIRYNAADSLAQLGVTQEDMQDILRGNDRYAKEMVSYMLEKRKAGTVHERKSRRVPTGSGNLLHRISYLIRHIPAFLRDRGRLEAVSKRPHAADTKRTEA